MVRILFVCLGNICRSPMAEFIMTALAASAGISTLEISSAATSNEEEGNPVYPQARQCLHRHGIACDAGKRARQIRPDDYRHFDLILCMERSNLRMLKRIIPDDPQGKIRLLLSYTGADRDIADPWYTGDFETCYQDLLHGCTALLTHLYSLPDTLPTQHISL